MDIKFTGPSSHDLMKAVMATAEKAITEKARKAAAPYGGVQVRFKRKSDGSLETVEFSGSDKAVNAARNAVAS